MSPSVCDRGRRSWVGPESGSAVVAHPATSGTVILRRHLPFWTTTGRFATAGTSVRVKLPSLPVIATAA